MARSPSPLAAILSPLLFSVALQAGAADSILEAPRSSDLAFSASEIDAYAELTWQAKLADERRAGLLGCRKYCDRIERVFGRLLVAAGRIFDAPPMRWQLAIGTNPREDAWSLAGGRVYVTEAMIDRDGVSDDELAFVLGHEMGHVLFEHDDESLTVARAIVSHGVARSVEDLYAELDFNIGLALELEPEWKAEEFEADRAGMLLGGTAGYDAGAMLCYLERLVGTDGDGHAVVAAHPAAAERLARARTFRSSAQVLRDRYASRRAADSREVPGGRR